MRRWEESNPTRWQYIQNLTSASLDKVVVTNVLRITCNDGGVGAEILAFVEGLEPWARFSNDGQPLIKENKEKITSLCGIGDGGANGTLQISIAIVWLIRESSAIQVQPRLYSTSGNVRADRFPDSGYYFNSPYFWYAPEDVNRAFWYLSNLRHHPTDRQVVDHQPAKQVKKGVDAGLASLHNSVSKGEWAGRLLRKDMVDKLGEAVDEQAEKMKSQLLYLRKWAYKTNPFFSKFCEGGLDDLLNIARRYIKTHNSDMDGFYKACVMVELYVWSWAHPGILSDTIEDMFADFKELLRWLHNHSATVGDDEGVGALLNGAVRVIAPGDRKTYFSRRAMIKETVYNAKFRN
ncbi:unnamed protein product [Alternaria alternata]|jgi:hypothetical protein